MVVVTNGVANVVVNGHFWFFWVVQYESDDEWSFDSVDLNELVLVPYNSEEEEGD